MSNLDKHTSFLVIHFMNKLVHQKIIIPQLSDYSQHHFKNSHQIIVLLIEFFQINNSSYRNNGAVDRIFPN